MAGGTQGSLGQRTPVPLHPCLQQKQGLEAEELQHRKCLWVSVCLSVKPGGRRPYPEGCGDGMRSCMLAAEPRRSAPVRLVIAAVCPRHLELGAQGAWLLDPQPPPRGGLQAQLGIPEGLNAWSLRGQWSQESPPMEAGLRIHGSQSQHPCPCRGALAVLPEPTTQPPWRPVPSTRKWGQYLLTLLMVSYRH